MKNRAAIATEATTSEVVVCLREIPMMYKQGDTTANTAPIPKAHQPEAPPESSCGPTATAAYPIRMTPMASRIVETHEMR